MLELFILGFLATILCFVGGRQFKYGLELGWIIVFLFLAFRYEYGNDYISYRNTFENYTYFAHKDIEVGWMWLNEIFQPLGFQWMIIVLSAFWCFTIYFMMKHFVPKEWWWLAMFIFVFQSQQMLVPLSMLRQSNAALLFLWAFYFQGKNKILLPLILIFVAGFIHRSAIILYPTVLFVSFINNKRISKYLPIILLVFISLMYLFSDQLYQYVFNMAMERDDVSIYYERYETEGAMRSISGIGNILSLLLNVTVSVFALKDFSRQTSHIKLIYIYSLMVFVVPVFQTYNMMINRFIYYFTPFFLLMFPNVIASLKRYKNGHIIQTCIVILLIVITIYETSNFLMSPGWFDSYNNYRTIFSV